MDGIDLRFDHVRRLIMESIQLPGALLHHHDWLHL